MVPLRLLVASLLFTILAVACVPTASASCDPVADPTPPTGGVTGMTYRYTFDSTNRVAAERCGPSGTGLAHDLANLTCQYLVGLDCL